MISWQNFFLLEDLGFNQENLYYEVHEKDTSSNKALENLVKTHIWDYYHADLEKTDRIDIYNKWKKGMDH